MMSEEQRLQSIFFAALNIESAADRAAYLDRACADHEGLRQRVEELLRAQPKLGGFLEGHASEMVASLNVPIIERVGTQIGPYKLREQIAEGGMGIVYVAEQVVPVTRRVALKVIKPGMDTKRVITRFEAERQALALMDHPNIAKVLDAGSTESGRPYFVMDLVDGLPLTDFCDKHNLSIPDRLQLFITVCQAVEHAHQKRIIHRDIKPSNVLVTGSGERAIPRVIDFGVAKAINQRLTEESIHTQFTEIIGTPLYMSPEQAEISGLDVDNRSDVYSLGVLLYELLTGMTPFDKERLRASSYNEIRRIIGEEEPLEPSKKVSSLGEAAKEIAACRRTDTKGLIALIRGELDWIVVKAMEKDRTRRYESASTFAVDIDRYLKDEPVMAYPPSTAYRLGKLARRQRDLFIGTATAGILVLALLVSIYFAVYAQKAERRAQKGFEDGRSARRQADDAVERAHEVNLRLEAALENEQRARAAAEESFDGTREVLDHLDEVSAEQLAHIPGLGGVREEILMAALRYYESVIASRRSLLALDEDSDQTELRTKLATTYTTLANLQYSLRRLQAASMSIERARDQWHRLIATHPNSAEFHRGLFAGFAIEGHLLMAQGRSRDAIAKHMEAVQQLSKFLADNPDARTTQCLVAARLNLGNLLADAKDRVRALKEFVSARRAAEELLVSQPTTVDYQRLVASALAAEAAMLDNLGEPKKAVESFTRAVAMQRKLTEMGTDNLEFQTELAVALNNLALAAWDAKDSQQALRAFKESIELRETLVKLQPTYLNHRSALANSFWNLGSLLAAAQRTDVAIDCFRRSIGLLEALVGVAPQEFRRLKVQVHAELGLAYAETKQWAKSAETRKEGLRELDAIEAKTQTDHWNVATFHYNLGASLAQLREFEAAAAHCEDAIRIRIDLLASSPGDPEVRQALAQSYQLKGTLQQNRGQPKAALSSLRSAIEFLEQLVHDFPENAVYRSHLTSVKRARADISGSQESVKQPDK